MYLDGHTIRLYPNAIEVYAGDGGSFYGEDDDRAYKQATEYWDRFFIKLEYQIKAIIKKDGVRNIKEVNWHFERGNSELCKKGLEEEGKHIRIYCPIDGKLAITTDGSLGGDNDETLHPKTAKPDRQELDKHLNDWRLNHPATNSQLQSSIAQLVAVQVETNRQLLEYQKQNKQHLALIKEYRAENKAWRKQFSRTIKSRNQTKLGGFL